MKKLFLLIALFLWGIPSLCFAASLNLTAPDYLPINTSCSYYSPEVRVDYSGLESQQYTFKIWLLESPVLNPAPDCASGCNAGFCPRVIEIDNTGGGLSSGYVSIVEIFDVHNYTEFDWVVRLYNEADTQVDWTEQITPGTYNRAPQLNNIGNKTGYVGSLLEFYVSGSDSDEDALIYSAYGLPPGASFDSGTGRFVWTPSEAGTYSEIKFRVTDNGEGNLYDDEVITITISNCILPSAPSSPSPSDSATGVPLDISLCWVEENATNYKLYLDTTCFPSLVDTINSNCYSLSGLTSDTVYYWYIVAQNNCGESRGPASGCWSFNTCALPSAPSSPEPADGANKVSVTTILNWANAEETANYSVYFGKTSPPAFVGTVNDSNYAPDTLEYDTTYHWKIESNNSCGTTTGPTWSLTTELQPSSNNPPNTPSNPSPSDGSASVSVTPTLSWSGGDPDGDTVIYDIYFGKSSSPPLVSSGQSSTSYSPDTLEYTTKYYWIIVSRDSNGAETTGPAWSFNTAIVGTNVDRAFQHLYEVMDKHHNSFDVYSDQDVGGNHGYPSGWMGDVGGLKMDTAWEEGCYNGNTCIKNTWITPVDQPWVGVMWQEPENNWGDIQDGGYNLTGATKIDFWARGEEGGEPVKFIVGGIQGEYPDSIQPQISTEIISLTKQWEKYTIDLTGKDITNVIGLFGWVTAIDPIFYLDDIQYNKSRSDELRFLGSFETLAVTDPDRYIRNASFVYDNALALLAFLARGNNDDLRRAGILADAFVYAMNNDRHYTDGRLRNAYMSGDLIDHLTGKVRMPGWWDPIDEKWYEDEFQVSTHTGNLAWVMIALLNYYKKVGGNQYLESAITLGEWIEGETKDARCAGGYTGGYEGWETESLKVDWKSTEHNIDVYVAFMLLNEITGDETWKERALHAKGFVETMWNQEDGHFWTGTLEDGCVINSSNIPADVNNWGLMALEDLSLYSRGIDWVINNCYTTCDGFEGFDFNDDRDGIWWEGTAHTVIAFQMLSRCSQADQYLGQLKQAQVSGLNTNGKGIIAACKDGVSTGFDWEYFARLHIGATAWYAFAELGHNPYWNVSSYPVEICDGADNDCDPATADGADETWLGNACDGADSDLCEEGVKECVGGAGPICSDTTGDDLEVCKDGLDNNCDGEIDEDCDEADGDVNEDGNITPQDALMTFQQYLGLIQLDESQLAHCDVNQDGSITPADALCIFKKYLGLPSCLD